MAKKHVILFAGTTEGRILANWLDEQSGVTGIVCVATEYGAELLEEEMSLKHLTVHCGRLDEGAMEAFLKKESPSLVIDATHPYAQVVTANIRKACEKYPDICLLRCLRKESEDEAKDSKGDKNGIIHVKNTAEAVRYLSEKEGNIFVLRPEMKPVSRLEKDYDKLMTFYDHGYEMMKRELPRLEAYLEK